MKFLYRNVYENGREGELTEGVCSYVSQTEAKQGVSRHLKPVGVNVVHAMSNKVIIFIPHKAKS